MVRSVRGPEPRRGIALLAYVVEPFLPAYQNELHRKHSNQWTARAIDRLLNDLGYDVDVTHWENRRAPPASVYDVVIGQGPAFEKSSRGQHEGCKCIYLGTTAYVTPIVSAENERLKQLYRRRGVRCHRRCYSKYNRDRGPARADAMFLLGTDWVVETYRSVSDAPIYRWANVVVEGVECTLNWKRHEKARQHFLWLAAYGAVHRGLDVLLEVFAARPEWHLWICGALDCERDFLRTYNHEMRYVPNIHYEGWVNVTSERFRALTARCAYALYPSASDAMAGSLVNCMASGLVPLTTTEAGTDTGGYGELIAECDPQTVSAIVDHAAKADPDVLREDSEGVAEFARQRYSREAFMKAFDAAFRAELT